MKKMTREEAIEAIKEAYGNTEYSAEIIKVLGQEFCISRQALKEPCEDAISRQATVEFLESHAETYEDVGVRMGFKAAASLVNNNNNLPSVTPQQ